MAATSLRATMIPLILAGASLGGGTPVLGEEATRTVDAASPSMTPAALAAHVTSDRFREASGRCATTRMIETMPGGPRASALADGGSGADCSRSSTTIRPEYDPEEGTFFVTLVFHVISNTERDGRLTDEVIKTQVDALNRDFLASHGIGADGTNAEIRFRLATVDPDGNPTRGVTRTTNDEWFDDRGDYYEALAWDPTRYVNVYTMCPDCSGGSPPLGYTYLPQVLGDLLGTPFDRIVLLYLIVGDPGPAPPYNRGRTLTHEMGHFFGLEHTFEDGCGTSSCYDSGDLICDTEPENHARFGCPTSATSCGTVDPFMNYMDYTDDLCMTEFTPEQVNRMRCSAEHYRSSLLDAVVAVGDAGSSAAPFSLGQNRPNPFNPTTRISFKLHQAGDVDLTILDAGGRVVRRLVARSMPVGLHEFDWDGRDDAADPVASGVYFYRLEAAGASTTRRMVLLK